MLPEKVTAAFATIFGEQPAYLIRTPGRVNLIGEHTDYNDGFVLPMAIERAIWIALRPRPDRQVRLHSLDFDESATFSLDRLEQGNGGWIEYIKGVAWALQAQGYPLQGWEGVVAGDIPVGAGLSSSAALEVAATRAFAAVSGWEWEPAPMARIGQRAENEWVGVNCGIMDQMIVAAGQEGHALLIDCRSLETEAVPLPPATAVVILDTNTRRGLVGSAYNERRQQCEAAAAFFDAPALRDVSLEQFEARADRLDPLIRRRARHVLTENERTLEAARAMQDGSAQTLGQLMDASHASLRDDFEVSSAELDAMAVCAQNHAASYGARMTGGGFGGCAVALVRQEAAGAFAEAVRDCYREATGREPQIYITQAGAGASASLYETGSEDAEVGSGG